MTYCVGIKVNSGIVFCSDSRTNAGIDQVNTYKKMYNFGVEGHCQYSILASGNLATTQGVINQIKKDIGTSAAINLLNIESVQDAAEYVGRINVAQQAKTGGGPVFQSNFLIGGQVSGQAHELAMIYPEGNYITATERTPFLQIGESKYGKPILDRIIHPETSLDTCGLCALVSMDSTLKSNLSVGPPIDLRFYHTNSFRLGEYYHFDEHNEYLAIVRNAWNQKLIDSFGALPPLDNHMQVQKQVMDNNITE